MHILLILLFLLLTFTPSVHAELPPHKPEMLAPDPDVPEAQELKPIYRGPMEFDTTDFFDTQAFEILAGLEFGFHLEDIILPFYQGKTEKISVPDLEGHATFAEKAQYLMMPQQVTSKTIHWSEINENIQSSLFCARIINQSKYSDEREDISSIGLQESENIPYSQKAFENWRKLNAANGLGSIESTNGYYDFNLPKELNSIKDARAYCLFKRKSNPIAEKENEVTQLSSWVENSDLINGSVWETIYEWVEKVFADGTAALIQVLAKFYPKFIVRFTQVGASPTEHFALAGDPTKEELKNTKQPFLSALAKTRGFAFNFLPEHRSQDADQKLEENRKWQTVYDFAIFGKTDGSRGAGRNLYGDSKAKSTKYPWNLGGNADTRIKQMACTTVPQELLDKGSILLTQVGVNVDGTPKDTSAISINDYCNPPVKPQSTGQCIEEGSIDTASDVEKKIGAAITNVCKKYDSNLPITIGQCQVMMKTIHFIETGFQGSAYTCVENAAGAAGPFQIKPESRDLVSCENEQMSDDISACKTSEEQLSRCVTEDAAELAMRIILNFSTCTNVDTLDTTAELYERVCGYGTGVGVPVPHLNNKTYCEHVFDEAGLPKP